MMHRLFACLMAVALLLAGTASASSQAEDPAPPSEDVAVNLQGFYQAWMSGDYLGADRAFRGLGVDEMEPKTQGTYVQFRPSLDGFVVEHERRAPAHEVDTSQFEDSERRNAVETIVERARETRIVIVNETHDNPRDRAFLLEVAEALRPLGFTHYAAETFDNAGDEEDLRARMEELAKRGYPNHHTGFYTNEPMFGFLVRRVLELGYRPVTYEHFFEGHAPPADMNESIRQREKGQAENLARTIAEAGPEAKFLIHVGYSHAAELPLAEGQLWMAGQLKALTGIDPLTVDQADLSQYYVPDLHRAIAPPAGDPAVIYFRDDAPLRVGGNAQAMDLQVVHPPIEVLGGRPDWLARTGRRAIVVPADMMPESGRRLVQVFLAADGEGAVPVDQILVEAGGEPPLVYVPEGEFRWVIQDG